MKTKRLLALVLSALMVFCAVPFTAISAEESDNEQPVRAQAVADQAIACEVDAIAPDALQTDAATLPLGDSECAHTYTVTESVAAQAHRAGYTKETCSLCGNTVTNWTDATDGIVVFVDKDFGTSTGIGTQDDPFSTYGKAIKYADPGFDRTIVLMSMVGLNQDFNEAVHTGTYTITAYYDGIQYEGGFDVNNASSYYNVNGPDIFENLTIDIQVSAVWQARHNKLVMGEGIACTGAQSDSLYLIGGINLKPDTTATESFAGKGTDLTVLSGRYKEVVGGNRNGALNAISGDIKIHVGGNAVIDKLFITTRNITDASLAVTGNSYVTLDGGTVNYYVTSTDLKAVNIPNVTPKGAVTVKVTQNFNIANSFTAADDSTVRGVCISNVFEVNVALGMQYLTSGTVKIHESVFSDIAFNNKIYVSGCHKVVAYSDNVVGDYDGDDELTNTDMTLLIRCLSGWILDRTVIDVTGDGRINNRDAIYLIQKLTEIASTPTYSIVFDNDNRASDNFSAALKYLAGSFKAAYGAHPSLKADANYKAESNNYTVMLGNTTLRPAVIKINDYAYKILPDMQVVINGGTPASILAGVKKFSADILKSSDGVSSSESNPALVEGTKYDYNETYSATSATINGIDIKNFKIAIKDNSYRADAEKLVVKLGAQNGYSIPIIDYSEISSSDKGIITLGTATRTNSETILAKYNGYRLVVSDNGGYTLGVIGSSASYYNSGYNKLISSIKSTVSSGAAAITIPSETIVNYEYPWEVSGDAWGEPYSSTSKTLATGLKYTYNVYYDADGYKYTANILYVDTSVYEFYLGTPSGGYSSYGTVLSQINYAEAYDGQNIYAGINGDRWDTWLGTARVHGLTIKHGSLIDRGLWDGGVHYGNTLSDKPFMALTNSGEYIIGNHAGKYDRSDYDMAVGGDFLLTWKGVPQYKSDFYAYGPVQESHLDHNPRTCVGYTDDQDLILVTINGRGYDGSYGANMEQAADLMTSLGCYMAMSLDGGGSTEMVAWDGGFKTMNKPSDGSSRVVRNTILIAKK